MGTYPFGDGNDDFFFDENSEFRPPDNKMIHYVLDTSTLLKQFASDPKLESYTREIMKVSSNTLKVLLAMSIGGYQLYCTEGDHAATLADLCTTLYDRLALTDPKAIEDIDISPLLKFREYREKGPDTDDIHFFSQDDD